MGHRMDWEGQRHNPRGYEDAHPRDTRTPLRGGSHVKPGPVRRWADMTPEERAKVLAETKGRKQ